MSERRQCAVPHCNAPPMRGESYCFAHHPDHRGKMDAARAKAAKACHRVTIEPPRSRADLKRVAGEVIAAVAAGKLSESQFKIIEKMMDRIEAEADDAAPDPQAEFIPVGTNHGPRQ